MSQIQTSPPPREDVTTAGHVSSWNTGISEKDEPSFSFIHGKGLRERKEKRVSKVNDTKYVNTRNKFFASEAFPDAHKLSLMHINLGLADDIPHEWYEN